MYYKVVQAVLYQHCFSPRRRSRSGSPHPQAPGRPLAALRSSQPSPRRDTHDQPTRNSTHTSIWTRRYLWTCALNRSADSKPCAFSSPPTTSPFLSTAPALCRSADGSISMCVCKLRTTSCPPFTPRDIAQPNATIHPYPRMLCLHPASSSQVIRSLCGGIHILLLHR